MSKMDTVGGYAQEKEEGLPTVSTLTFYMFNMVVISISQGTFSAKMRSIGHLFLPLAPVNTLTIAVFS